MPFSFLDDVDNSGVNSDFSTGAKNKPVTSFLSDMGQSQSVEPEWSDVKPEPITVAPVPNAPEETRQSLVAARAAVVNQANKPVDPERGVIGDWLEMYHRGSGDDALAIAQNSIADNVRDQDQRRELHQYVAELSSQYSKAKEKNPVEADSMLKQFFLSTANPTLVKSVGLEIGKEAAIQAGLHLSGIAEASGETAAVLEAARATRTIKGFFDAARLGWKGAKGVANAANIVGTAVINYETWGKQISGEIKNELITQNPGIDLDILDHASQVSGILSAGIFSVGMPKSVEQYLKPALKEALGRGAQNGIKNAFKEMLLGTVKMEGAMVASDVASRWQTNEAAHNQFMLDIERHVIAADTDELNDSKYAQIKRWDFVLREWQVAKDSLPMALGMGAISGVARGIGETVALKNKQRAGELESTRKQAEEAGIVLETASHHREVVEKETERIRTENNISPADLAGKTATERIELREKINDDYKKSTGDSSDLVSNDQDLHNFFNTTPEDAKLENEIRGNKIALQAFKEMNAKVDEELAFYKKNGMDWRDHKDSIKEEIKKIREKYGFKRGEVEEDLSNFIEGSARKISEKKERAGLGEYAEPKPSATKEEHAAYRDKIFNEYNARRKEAGLLAIPRPTEANPLRPNKLREMARFLKNKTRFPEEIKREKEQPKAVKNIQKEIAEKSKREAEAIKSRAAEAKRAGPKEEKPKPEKKPPEPKPTGGEKPAAGEPVVNEFDKIREKAIAKKSKAEAKLKKTL